MSTKKAKELRITQNLVRIKYWVNYGKQNDSLQSNIVGQSKVNTIE
jgi:hypothetical protein